ncbi:hypothetical protein [Acidiphilium sp.]|uniref:hypothetical protein n=1 Tax=Acidiphilium sp. TaxID=527 RepID=UPI003CFDE1B0
MSAAPELPIIPRMPKSRRLLILACSQRKRRDLARSLAIDFYDGPLWQTLRTVDHTGVHAQVAVLSALYGLRDARFEQIADLHYDQVMTRDRADAMIAGGITTRWPRPPRRSLPDTFGIAPAAEIFSMTRALDGPFVDVAIVGGHLYIDVARSWIPDFIKSGWIAHDAPLTIINNAIGRMRQSLRQWLVQRGPLDLHAAPASSSP